MPHSNWPPRPNTGFVGPSTDRQAVEDLFEAVETEDESPPSVEPPAQETEEDAPVPRNRLRGEKTWLTGAQIAHLLWQLGISDRKFCRDAGFNEMNGKRMLKGKSDGDIPKSVELQLRLYIVDPSTRRPKGDIDLPLEEHGFTLLTPGAAGVDRRVR
jgi:hypothetical protein